MKPETIPFTHLQPGDLFKFRSRIFPGGHTYLKTENWRGISFADLNTGELIQEVDLCREPEDVKVYRVAECVRYYPPEKAATDAPRCPHTGSGDHSG